jgi:hypothetical protein
VTALSDHLGRIAAIGLASAQSVTLAMQRSTENPTVKQRVVIDDPVSAREPSKAAVARAYHRVQKLSTGEETLALHLRAAAGKGDWKAGVVVRQYRFDPTRKWAFDFAWPCEQLAVEIQGLTKGRTPGAHQRVDGLTREYEKLNAAVLAGWRVLLFTPAQVKSGYALDTIRKALA